MKKLTIELTDSEDMRYALRSLLMDVPARVKDLQTRGMPFGDENNVKARIESYVEIAEAFAKVTL